MSDQQMPEQEKPDHELTPMSREELAAEGGAHLPDKEVVSILDLNADLDLDLDAAAPIDLAVAANANVAAPIDAAAAANILSVGSTAGAVADQDAQIDQGITGEAMATGGQTSTIDQSEEPAGETTDGTTALPTDGTTALPGDTTSALDGDLLNVDVNLAGDVDLAAPISGAVAANANVAAPINAAVAANVASIDSDAVAVAQQDAVINQQIDADAEATTDQDSEINQ
jgi:hypothetical protein